MKVKIPVIRSKKEQKAMNEEIRAQLMEARTRDSDEFDAAILWAMHLRYGHGKKRLRDFYDFFRGLYLNSGRWQFGRDEVELLKGIGVDIEEWNRVDAD